MEWVESQLQKKENKLTPGLQARLPLITGPGPQTGGGIKE